MNRTRSSTQHEPAQLLGTEQNTPADTPQTSGHLPLSLVAYLTGDVQRRLAIVRLYFNERIARPIGIGEQQP